MATFVRGLSVVAVVCALCAKAGCSDATDVLLSPGERVVGRARDGERVRLLTTDHRLITVRLSDWSVESHPLVGLDPGEEPWGLARTEDGLWTLVGNFTVVRLDQDGSVRERVSLNRPHLAIYGVDDTLLVQPARVAANEAVLRRIDLGTEMSEPVGSLRTSAHETRAETLARNLVGCGSTQSHELPCWFNHGQTIDRVSLAGSSRPVGLRRDALVPARDSSDPEDIERPGPIVDAHIDDAGVLWVLLRGSEMNAPTRFVLARYEEDGELAQTTRLEGRPRLILTAEGRRCDLLVGTGQPLTVTMP